MNPSLEVRLLAHSIDAATLSAGRKRRKRSNADVYVAIAVLLILAGCAAWL